MKTKVLIIIIAFASSMAFGQKKLADKFFENYGYIKASELYEIAVKKGDKYIRIFLIVMILVMALKLWFF